MLSFALSRNHTLEWADMSTGKTLFALILCEYFSGLRIIASSKRPMVNYAQDYEESYNEKPYNLYVLFDGTIAEREQQIDRIHASGEEAVVVINYEAAAKINWKKYKISLAIADEAHALASWSGSTSRHLAKTMAHVPVKVAMSGTPSHDGYERLYGIFRWLEPVLPQAKNGYPTSALFGHYNDFLSDYCVTYTKGYATIIRGYKNIAGLAEKINPFTLRVKTEDVIKLPKAAHHTLKFDLTPETLKQYKLLESEGIITGDDTSVLAPHVLSRTIRLQQLVCSGALPNDAGELTTFDIEARKQTLIDALKMFSDEPAVIFTKFSQDVTNVADVIQTLTGETVAHLTGDLDQHQEWRNGDYRVLVANLSAGSEGVRLQRARVAIYWSVGYSLKEFKQSQMRIRRYGQLSPEVHFVYIVANGTIDETIYEALRLKAIEVDDLDEAVN